MAGTAPRPTNATQQMIQGVYASIRLFAVVGSLSFLAGTLAGLAVGLMVAPDMAAFFAVLGGELCLLSLGPWGSTV